MQGPTLELRDMMVRAGAGAGKTRGLVEKVVEVFRTSSEKSPRIILTTFTRKATQELKERLIYRAVNEQDPELLQFVTDSNRLHISTIHGLLNLFLKQVGHLAGLDPGFQIISEREADHLSRLTMREILVRDERAQNWLEIYGFERLLRMCHSYQNFYREQGALRPGNMDDIRRAVGARIQYWRAELGELIAEIRESTDEESWVRFADDLQAEIVRWSHALPNLENLPGKPRKTKKQMEWESLHLSAERVFKRLKDELGKPCWNAELWPQMMDAWEEFAPLAEAFAQVLRELKESQARFEMEDLELKTLEILREKPFLAGVFSESWDFWMIDEYQDTSPIQVEILNELIGEHPRYLVGDPQQSIYLFRGAEVGVFSEAEKEISANGGRTLELIKNYRSAPDLLLWINDFMQSVNDSFMRMEPRAPVDAEAAKPCVTLFRAPDASTELDGIVHFVHRLLAGGAKLEEICVISRTHRGLMDVSAKLKQFGYPTHVHSARGFSSRREVMDAQALWKFLVNPHDNLNLLVLLRSPWYFVEDWQLEDWMSSRPASLWRKLTNLEVVPEAVVRLRATRANLNQEGIARAFERALCENAMLDLSLVNDPAGRKESNLWKLIHKAQMLEKEGGQTILDVIASESDNPMEANEGDATSAQEPNCINLMTIHGSKGLEFDHVIVPRMNEPPRTSNTQPFFAREGVFFFPVWDESEGEFASSPLDFSAVQEMRARELAEFDRWLYVALTRAKKSLTLSWSGEGKESWVSRSPWFAKSKGVHSTPSYTYEVLEEVEPPVRYESGAEDEVKVRPEFQRRAARTEDEHLSVSELVERGLQTTNADLLRRWQAQSTGVRVHRALEALKYGADPAIEGPDREAVNYVLALKDPPLAEFIRKGSAEWGFQVRTKNGVVEGQIDLWCKHDGKLFVVDYKSGSPKGKEAAFKQLSLYSWALRKFGHKEPVTMVVVYPLLKKTEAQSFTEDLFQHWESEFGGTQA